jgi:biotin synthase
MAGANSIFYGEKLLTTGNPDTLHDQELFRRLKIRGAGSFSHADGASVAS